MKGIKKVIHAYKLDGYNIILDASSGSIHNVDDVAYDAIVLREDLSADVVKEVLMSNFSQLPESEIDGLMQDIDELIACGKLFAPDHFVSEKTKKALPLKALCLNISHTCNMNCAYCFAGKGEYGGDEKLMNLEIGKRAIDFLIENSKGRSNLDVDFFGGEPLLNWDVVKEIVKYARSIEQKHEKHFRFTLTTNGLMIDEDVIEFSNREMHNIVLSLDGRPEIHDKHRILPDGKGSYDHVLPKLKKIVEARNGKGYYIRGTFTPENLDFVNDILHIADLGFKEISLEPSVAKLGSPFGFANEDLPELFRQYELLAAKMLDREKEGRGFNFYHYTLDLSGGPCVHKRIAGCGVGTEYMAVTPDGKLYPCHQFVGDDEFLIGDIWRGATNEKLREQFAQTDIYSRAACKDCWARFFCSGGCAANAYNDTSVVHGVYDIGCALFKKRLECAIMMKVAQQCSE
ncbi:MAG: thioether cross-link-forming SCIFF peptide maturase [Oscillospiraceae bacterium]|nr:thioether cross-link-forming SCIFF peptide maturase [Oscillospiraceae bacterium]